MSKSKKRISGTREWSVASVNCVSGCTHDCCYCYARANAQRFGRIQSPAEWSTMKIRQSEVARARKKIEGTVMFPTTHDITPEVLPACLAVLQKLVEAGCRVLVVSKPHYDCIAQITHNRSWREQVRFRFTIGALSEELLAYWEPGAPTFEERFATLCRTKSVGWATSVSCEPLLEADRVVELVDRLAPHCTDSIWIGRLNQVRDRCRPTASEEAIRRIEAGQTGERVRAVYAALRDHPLLRWKESYKRVLGLQVAAG